MPLAPRSVTGEHIAEGAIRPEHLQLGVVTGLSLASFSTTTQNAWLTVASKDFYVPTKRCALKVELNECVAHTVAGARWGFGLWLYDMDTGSPLNGVVAWTQGVSSARGLVIPTLEFFHPYNAPAFMSFDTDHLNRNPGLKRLYFVAAMWTAGTLVLGDPAQESAWALLTLQGRQ